MASILLIDDDVTFAACLRSELEEQQHRVEYMERAEKGPDRLAAGGFDMVLLDNIMPRMTGLEFLKVLKLRSIKVPVVLMTSSSSSDTAIQARVLEAFDYVIKPGNIETLALNLEPIIALAVEFTRPKEVYVPGSTVRAPHDGPELIGDSPPMLDVYTRIGQFANSELPVLILGERGTGKELVARAFHSYSSRKNGPFVPLDCNALPPSILERELFGNERGVYTGADRDRKGMIEHADGGTLFLDEIGELSKDLQGKLLRVLQERAIRRLGGAESIPVNFRLLAATNRNLRLECREDRFREDLYDRLNGVTIRLPPLRERPGDLPALVDFFLRQAAARDGAKPPAVSKEAMDKIVAYDWPGNIRVLQNKIRLAVGLCRGGLLLPSHLELTTEEDAGALVSPRDSPTTEDAAIAALQKTIAWAWDANQGELWPFLRDLLEKELLRVAMERLDGNQSRIAERLGMVWNTVSKRIKTYGLK